MSNQTYPALCPDCLQPLTVSCPPQKHECKAVAVGPALTCLPSEELDRLRAEVASLKEELSKFQESSFNPDWSLLQSTQESLREHMALLHQQNSQIEVLKDLLERAQNGLRWYADMHPEDASEADGEMHVEIDEALA